MHILYKTLSILFLFLFITLLFFRKSNELEDIERILGNCANKYKENFTKHNTTSPILIYLYDPTDPVMNSVGNWLKNNSKDYFENRFTSMYFFTVEEEISLDTLYKTMNQILKFQNSFTSENKIMFAIRCHGAKHIMCNHETQEWLEFFKKIKSQTGSELALITSACNSGNFFYQTYSPFANEDKYKTLFEFIITGAPLGDGEEDCFAAHSNFWKEDLKDSTRIDNRNEVLILAYPMFRFLTGISADPTPAEMLQFYYDPAWINFIPTPNIEQWKEMQRGNTSLQAISKGICPQKFKCIEGEDLH